MANTKVTGDLIASGTITAANLVSGTLDTLLDGYLTTNTYATQSYVTSAVNNLIAAAPASLDTLNELAAALNDDANFATTVTNSLATKLNLSGGTLTGALSFQDTAIPSAGTAGIFSRNTNSYLYLQTGSGNQIQLLDGSQNTMAIFNPSSVSFSISNSPALVIDSNSNVGIGVTTVGDKLHIRDASLDSDVGIKIGNDSRDWILKLFGSDSDKFKIYTHDKNNVFVLDTAGNIGITASAAIRFNGTGDVSHAVGYDSVVDGSFLRGQNGVRFLTGVSGGVERARIDQNGVFQLGSSSALGYINANSTDLEIDINRNPETGAFSDTSKGHARISLRAEDAGPGSRIIFSTASAANTVGSERMRIYSDGDVTIYERLGVGVIGDSVGGQPGGTSGKLNVYTNTGSSSWAQQIRHDNSTGNGLFVRAGGNSNYYTAYLTGYDENNVHLAVRGDGNVGIGTDSPYKALEVKNSYNGSQLTLRSTSGNSGNAGLRFSIADNTVSSDSYHKASIWLTGTGAGNALGALTFNVNGNASNVNVSSADERLRILPSGGISFNGDTAAANALDDYEEGSWTPTLNNAGSPVYGVQYGRYTKIGNLVFITMKLEVSNITTGSQVFEINGIPFNPTDAADNKQRSSGIVEGDWVNMGSYIPSIRFRLAGNGLTGVRDNLSDGSSVYFTYSNLSSSSIQFNTSLTYRIE